MHICYLLKIHWYKFYVIDFFSFFLFGNFLAKKINTVTISEGNA